MTDEYFYLKLSTSTISTERTVELRHPGEDVLHHSGGSCMPMGMLNTHEQDQRTHEQDTFWWSRYAHLMGNCY